MPFNVIQGHRGRYQSIACMQLTSYLVPFRSYRSLVFKFWTIYDVHLGLTGKCIVDFLLVLIELFVLGVMAEELQANIGSKSAISLQWGPDDPEFQVEGVTPTNHNLLSKLG